MVMGGFPTHLNSGNQSYLILKNYYGLTKESSILDIGCAKGFMLNDFIEEIPGINAKIVDISNYANQHCKESVKNLVDVGDARALPFEDNAFDLVISINTSII